MADLEIRDLHVTVDKQPILRGISLDVNRGELVAIMGPNGSGKSTLAATLLGSPTITITKGMITFLGKDITTLAPDKRAKLGLFLSFQYPAAIPGVSVSNFLRTAVGAVTGTHPDPVRFHALLKETMASLKIDPAFASRALNEGFSGGEKKQTEILQLLMLKPKLAILDEVDSGLDVDSVKIVAEGVQRLVSPAFGALVITHYQRLLDYLTPHTVNIMINGKFVKSGGPELVAAIEKQGYDWLKPPPPL
ncbi:MAG: Fe-S cluster assembly ATPase SufC [Nanoarchaeota archaeon]|nr:Fe-S cluster assembly ATPase SufC [Nanoarchaeota archaeon]